MGLPTKPTAEPLTTHHKTRQLIMQTQRLIKNYLDQGSWVASPQKGVERFILEREGDEVAKATSIVRYAAGAGYTAHTHGGGEEILVLEGVFSDEHGHYPQGTYLRHPPGSSHTPYSTSGCTLFVKLWQFLEGDTGLHRIATEPGQWRQGLVPGLSVLPLHEFNGVNTALVKWAPNTVFNLHTHPGGEEILVLDGVFKDEYGEYSTGSWIKSPPYSRHAPFTGPEGALIYVKVGHMGIPSLWDLR